jgi:hypothetical protein
MGEIRVFTEEHVRDVADLNLKAIRGRKEPSGPGLQNGFRDIFLNNPWVTPDIPSLVYLEQGKLVGFLGVIPRTMEFRGKPIRVAVTSQFMIDREMHKGSGAIELMRRCFRGGQDLSFSDGAGEGSYIVWKSLGGRTALLYSLNWSRLLRPLGTAVSLLDRTNSRPLQYSKGAARLVGSAGDFLISKLPLGILRAPHSAYSAKLVSRAELLECINEIGWREPLKPIYTQTSFDWLLAQAAKASHSGNLRLMTVYDPQGARIGWFVYYAKSSGAAYVLQIGVRRKDQFRFVLQALFQDAWEMGCHTVKGQPIPQFMTELTEQHCIFRHPNPSVLIQTKDAEMMSIIQSGDAAITRLDGECWLPLGSLN